MLLNKYIISLQSPLTIIRLAGFLFSTMKRLKEGIKKANRAYYMNGFWHGSGSMSGVKAWQPMPDAYEGGAIGVYACD